MKRSPLARRTPLKRGGSLARRTPLRSMSRKRSKQQRERYRMVRSELNRRPRCEAGPLIRGLWDEMYGWQKAEAMWATMGCGGRACDVHEPLTRARGGSITDPTNTVTVCRWCHGWIHQHVEKATQLGLLVSSK
jgi:hypothetical protein